MVRIFQYRTMIPYMRLVLCVITVCLSSVAKAQMDDLQTYLQRSVQVKTIGAKEGPRVNAKYNFSSVKTIISRGEMKIVNGGIEDNTELGLAPIFGAVRTRFTYNLHRFDTVEAAGQTEVVRFGLDYALLHLRYTQTDTEQLTSIGLPFNYHNVHFNLSYTQNHLYESGDLYGAYRLDTKLQHLRLIAIWQEKDSGRWSGLSTEYIPSKNLKMKCSYSNDGSLIQKRIRGEYKGTGYQFAGEFKSISDTESETHDISTIGIKRLMKLATLSVNYEHDGYDGSSALYFKVETHDMF